MASRQMKMPVRDDAEKSPEADDVFSHNVGGRSLAGTCSGSTSKPEEYRAQALHCRATSAVVHSPHRSTALGRTTNCAPVPQPSKPLR